MNKLLATAALALVASLSSIPAHAASNANGVKLNGIFFNGQACNGIKLNGLRLNGYVWNGIKMNGYAWNGTQATGLQASTVFAVTLPEGVAK
ncbi:hypothetical protein DFR24_2579 [Panacagrimonas perspica]|uniref:Uncharacterized protein n=1 Tax=Panacagrimonas perspica TaxID=381431 RepID=A0A4S3K0A1_9GAMM|nr:hypothetical protein [Panacagrimonas perspica]TDU28214.1 hypothetical protein DFR24_2579 [Panacagrimonas perspica]THD01296.1 hypothetical protein B1810_20625 [Panacagrimonas perspica]